MWRLNPELFTEKEKLDKLIKSLITKIEDAKQELGFSQNKVKKTARLESKLSLLQETLTELTKNNTQLEEELQIEREEAERALDKAKEWREKQLNEITDQKDKEISELKNNLETEKNIQSKLTL